MPLARLAAAFVGLVLAVPAQAEMPPLRIAMTLGDIPSTDGAPDQGTEGIRFMGYTLYDPLVMWDLSSRDAPAKLVPGLATEWHQNPADPTKWLFSLRHGVTFHDGSAFDADAVIWNIARILDEKAPQYDPKARGQALAALWPLTSWRKVDDFTVELGTAGVDVIMPTLLNRFLLASPAQWEKMGRNWEAFRRQPSGTGPWKMKEWQARERAELVRNASYWNPARVPKAERMVLLPIPEVATRTAALLSGQVDWIEAPAPDSLQKLRQAGFKIETNTIPHIWPYTLSVLPDAPTADIRVRKALNLAVDREGLVEVLGGLAVPSVANVPQGHPWFGSPSFKIRYDPAEAKKLLAEAGYGPGKRLKIKVLSSTSGSGQMYPLIMNQAIQQNLVEVGVDLEIEVFDWNALTSRSRLGAKAPENKGATALNSSWNTMEPHNAFLRFADSKLIPPKGSNWGYIDDAELDGLVAQARREPDPAKLDAILARIDTRMVDQAYFLWVVHDVWPNALSPKVKGYVHPQSWYVDFSPVTVAN